MRLRLDPPDGDSVTRFDLGDAIPEVLAGHTPLRSAYPQHFQGAAPVEPGGRYHWAWSAQLDNDGPWTTLAAGEHVAR